MSRNSEWDNKVIDKAEYRIRVVQKLLRQEKTQYIIETQQANKHTKNKQRERELLFASLRQEGFIPICPFNWDSATAVSTASTDLSNSSTDIAWSKIG